MPTTTTTSSSPPRPRAAEAARARAVTLAAAILLLLAHGVAQAEPVLPARAAPGDPRPRVMLMTGLPLVWGEKGPFDPASRPAAAYVELARTFAFEPLDVLDEASLERGKLLFLAQPQRLAPAELVALDGWIRRGGRALILTDPMLTWPSELPPGDIRRAPAVGLLAPLLHHWQLALDPPAEAAEVAARWEGRRIVLDAPGRFRSSSPNCTVGAQSWTATCRIGLGRVRLVADADLMRDSLWAPSGVEPRSADNPAVVGAWLDELAGISRRDSRAPRVAWLAGREIWLTAAAILSAAAIAVGLLLRRRRKR